MTPGRCGSAIHKSTIDGLSSITPWYWRLWAVAAVRPSRRTGVVGQWGQDELRVAGPMRVRFSFLHSARRAQVVV